MSTGPASKRLLTERLLILLKDDCEPGVVSGLSLVLPQHQPGEPAGEAATLVVDGVVVRENLRAAAASVVVLPVDVTERHHVFTAVDKTARNGKALAVYTR